MNEEEAKNIRVWNKTRKKASFTRTTRREKIMINNPKLIEDIIKNIKNTTKEELDIAIEEREEK